MSKSFDSPEWRTAATKVAIIHLEAANSLKNWNDRDRQVRQRQKAGGKEPMSVTTLEFEQHLNGWLAEMENWRRCEWCGCDDGQKRIGHGANSVIACKEWRPQGPACGGVEQVKS